MVDEQSWCCTVQWLMTRKKSLYMLSKDAIKQVFNLSLSNSHTWLLEATVSAFILRPLGIQ